MTVTTPARCSTPFGIREVGTPESKANRTSPSLVLNAFRHQRGGHPGVQPHRPDQDDVLNAFRHQRGGHKAFKLAPAGAKMCSTPFGIREVGTRRNAAHAHLDADVLNAFRHQRGGHVDNVFFQIQGVLCSTPFGIREVGTGLCGRRTTDRYRVLNAFRHQRGGHPTIRAKASTNAASAQRLSASERWAPERLDHDLAPGDRCSTPFGIREVGTCPKSRGTSRPMLVLNAFRHQRGGHSPHRKSLIVCPLKRWFSRIASVLVSRGR